mmetsp:Transcript_9615/g.21673  ORF Transcript_9615/g.21673 Transcript_9615/m.21673 type:complete len:2178 (+) Transcript_9615:367-6900(+)|eukprot:CAMPEP_0172307806 /NCGR_PEP_ID=MMETSP1058-20130122/8577_1 /TAXON_ID=83371 /ORGANISM="Detonula confervacea, Strain CCMP 353" /LENGTH=2177 /DNA_ID=CAMNT_0013020079 /DNA_START=272 /DNA_END=6805 /DNA_ORIENTATION=-
MTSPSTLPTLRIYRDWATRGPTSHYLSLALTTLLPTLRILLAIFFLWHLAGLRKQRKLTASLTAILAAFCTFAFLRTMFFHDHVSVGDDTTKKNNGVELTHVALVILSLTAAMVGGALGSMLPRPMAGVTLGCGLALMAGAFVPEASGGGVGLFVVAGPVMALVGGVLTTRFYNSLILTLSTIIILGGFIFSIAVPHAFLFLRNVALGSTSPVANGHAPSLAWLASCAITASVMAYRDPSLLRVLRGGTRERLAPDDETLKPDTNTTPKPVYAAPAPANPEAFNMFDPADLPPRLSEYANMVYSACEDLGNFFGFQDASVRNQAEHLLILLSNNRRYMNGHILPPALQPPSPIHALHAKVFSNYMKWCRYQGVPPHFSKMSASSTAGMAAPPSVASRVVDLVLFFCVWGEACNIRHMPECLWFLYHKMMEEFSAGGGGGGNGAMSVEGQAQQVVQPRSLYAGHFLDYAVTPIYKIVSTNMKSSADHVSKRNYDDFNEFFWSRDCLQYRYSCEDPNESTDVEDPNRLTAPLPGELLLPITVGMKNAPKTFLEKRSWLRGIMALSRIVEWHIVTFYLLSVLAFSHDLVWGWVYTLQVASGVFWLFNSLAICWGLLEVWASYPGIHLSGTAIFGSVFVLVARFLILVYQTLYLMWTFGPSKGEYLGIEADSTFWWWQYVWLSLLCMAPYALETLTNLFPAISTRLCTSRNDYVQTFLNILFPSSRLYVGKEMHESFKHTAVYTFFWATLVSWKLFFSYVFEVYSMVLPTIELTDDYANFPNQSFVKMGLLLLLRWLPQFLVYCIDMSIWYAVWQAFAGTSVGFSDHLGDIRSMKDIRNSFGRAPEHFCTKMLSPDAGSRRGSSASFLSAGDLNSNESLDNKRQSLMNPNSKEGQSLLGSDPHKLQGYVNRLLDVRIQKWVMFSTVWNEVIDHFREEDLISNRERDYMKFSRFDGFSQAIYLPVFQTAGVVEEALALLERSTDDYAFTGDNELFKPILNHVTMRTAVSEVWELGNYVLLKLLGQVHNDDAVYIMNYVLKWVESGTVSDHMKIVKIRVVVQTLIQLVDVLGKGIGRRKPASQRRSTGKTKKRNEPTGPPARGIRRAISASSLTTNVARQTPIEVSQVKNDENVVIVDALRDHTRDKFRALINSLKGIMNSADPESKEVMDRLTFALSMENGFFWDDAYASDALDDMARSDIFKSVLTKLQGLVACHPDEVEPKSKEARRRLTFFVNSLFMDMPNAPSIHDMFSWNVLTPYYKESVTLNKGDLETRSDALGVSTMLYLQTLYKADWANFLERLGLQDEEKVWSKKNADETRQWASIRAQTLNRTISGMMYFEKALRLLANLERLDDDTTNDLMGEKFGYIVACQVYGQMKRDQDSKADDIDNLMHRYPHMRVAYIDSIRNNRSGEMSFYSCLVKSNSKGKIEEIYRVRLPGNPILGEGKPENQNHAMIFTRGEFVQTIDMNQEGYFEEALKMRNALQEFAKRDGPMPTTILGLREHIFTGSVSSLANYMALQETSFVTLGQRVLTKPLCIRLHYGHPDVFDKLFFITRGGISKSSKGINLSEDIFAGYNNAIRGGQVAFKEYMQVGKGRDVGMSQIYQFEAKLSQGAGEQSLSRDVYRLCHRLDFSRLLSYYFGGIGHYFSNVLTVFTVYVVVYLMAILALYDLEKIGDRLITPSGTIQMLLGGLGLLQTIPLFATLGVERGWWASFRELVGVFATGGPLHFMFHIQTKANYMTQTILVGGAKYRPTGRGFVTQHTPMDELYRFFASSHLYLGVEMGAGLIIMGIYSEAGQYFGRTWSLWLASLSFIASPFWFNPLTFDWNMVTADYVKYIAWLRGTAGGAARSWSIWWNEENSFYSKMPFASKIWFIIKAILYLTIADGIARSDLMKADTTLSQPKVAVPFVVASIIILLASWWLLSMVEHMMPYPVRRTTGILIGIGLMVSCITALIEDSNFFRYGFAAYYGIGAMCQIGLLFGSKFVKNFYFIHDLVCGHIIFFPLFILAILQIPHHIQTWLLYHNALSSDVVVSNILRYARKSQESGGTSAPNEDLVEQISELRKIVQKQEQMIGNLGSGNSKVSLSVAQNPSTDAIASLIKAPSREALNIQPSVGGYSRTGMGGRTLSASTLDVWGEMALGDAAVSQGGYQTAPARHSTSTSGTGDFSFTQPDVMPPR